MSFKHISIDDARALLDQRDDVAIADIRDVGSFRAGYIANAVNIRQDNIDEFLSTIDKDKPLLVYCYHGHSSQGAADYFFGRGYKEVYSLDGGYEAWRTKY